jgi:hypothetical protein
MSSAGTKVGLTLQEVEGHAETQPSYLLVREFWGRGIGMRLDRRIDKWGKPICVYSIIRGEVSLDSLPLSGGTRFPGGD